MNKRSSVRMLVAALGMATAIGASTRPAAACGDVWVPYMDNGIDYRPQGVSRAEQGFDDGKIYASAASVLRMMPHVRALKPASATIVARAQRMLALAVARSNGALPVEGQVPWWVQGRWLGGTEADRAANLEWAVTTLRGIADTKAKDPASMTDLGEALARVDAHKAEARSVLEALAKKDLLATPEAYAALAELRGESGDASGKKLALARCQSMSNGAAVCRDATAHTG
ncbi:MAG: hypothetical protein OZ921_01660 [Sorangiineae bacterium]|nr:hypothetical protein [Polyangiaceae bacterium]MEB2321189.1 hypothetical protein [Sorangiineae bacterium]